MVLMCSISTLLLAIGHCNQISFHSQRQQPILPPKCPLQPNPQAQLRQSETKCSGQSITLTIIAILPRSPSPLLLKNKTSTKQTKSIKKDASKNKREGLNPFSASSIKRQGRNIHFPQVPFLSFSSRKIKEKKRKQKAAATRSPDLTTSFLVKWTKQMKETDHFRLQVVFGGLFLVCTTLSSRSRYGYCMGSFSFCVRRFSSSQPILVRYGV